MQALTIAGLILNGIRALFIALTELWRPPPINREDTIDQLKAGRSAFFEQGTLSDGNPGFCTVVAAVDPQVETHVQ